jgi:uncharacterized membrane protein
MKKALVTDRSIENLISVLLLTGVLISAGFVLGGGVYFVLRHGAERADYHIFRGQPSVDRLLGGIIRGALALRSRSVIQLGILLLIATPIVRVAASLAGFALEGDRRYVIVTSIVLAVLLYSFVSGGVAG